LLPLAGNGPDVFLRARHGRLSRRQSRRVADRAVAARGDELGAPGRPDHRPAQPAGVSLGGSRRGRADHHPKIRRAPPHPPPYPEESAPPPPPRDSPPPPPTRIPPKPPPRS